MWLIIFITASSVFGGRYIASRRKPASPSGNGPSDDDIIAKNKQWYKIGYGDGYAQRNPQLVSEACYHIGFAIGGQDYQQGLPANNDPARGECDLARPRPLEEGS